MSVWIEGYTEAKVNGRWECIDFYQYDAKGKLRICPCIFGQSMVRAALEWDCTRTSYGVTMPDGMSEAVRKAFHVDDKPSGEFYGSWYVVDGDWFSKADLSLPEYCGFFPRSDVNRFLSHPDQEEMNVDNMISAEEYHKLDKEEKKAYQYFEYTDPYGSRQILRDFKQAVLSRIYHRNEISDWSADEPEIKLSDVRVVLLES